MAETAGALYEFGRFRLDPVRRRLLAEGRPVALRPKAFDLLLVLVQKGSRIVEKDELIRLVWPDATVEESNLPHTISKLRKILAERPNEHRFIVTVPGRGYRFVAKVHEVGHASELAAHDAASAPRARQAALDARVTRLIVLPFRVMRADPQIEFLAFSLPDAVTTSLSAFESLIVRSSATASQFAHDPVDLRIAAAKADVDVVLTGSLLREGDQLRVNAQLVESNAGTVLWSQTSQAPLGNILQLQDDLVRRIVTSLAPALTSGNRGQLRAQQATPKIDTEVYAAYLKGRYHWNRRTPDSLARAIACFEDAIRGSADYAPAHAGLADCYMLGALRSLSRRESAMRAKSAALRALALDDDLAEAHASLAAVAFRWEWDWSTAQREFTRALELNPRNASVRHGYALLLAAMGRFPEALSEMRHGCEIDPVSLVINAGVGRVLDFARCHRDAIDQYLKTLEIDAGFAEAYFDLAMAHQHAGSFDEAMAAARQAAALAPDSIAYSNYLACLQAVAGDHTAAEAWLDRWVSPSPKRYVSPVLFALLQAAIGRFDEAFTSFEAACEERASELVYLIADPDFDCFRSDPRLDAVLARIGFPQRNETMRNIRAVSRFA